MSSAGWYWRGATKTDLYNALSDQPDGSFAVRDASTPGDFTLTIRLKGATKLVRVHVGRDGRCGFSPDQLGFHSLDELVRVHSTQSLKMYNDNLDVCLLHPVTRLNSLDIHTTPSVARPQVTKSASRDLPCAVPAPLPAEKKESLEDREFRRRLGMEEYRTAQIEALRAARMFDLAHSEHQRAEALNHALARTVADMNRKLELLKGVSTEQLEVITEETGGGDGGGAEENGNVDGERDRAMDENRQGLSAMQDALRDERDAHVAKQIKLKDLIELLRGEMEAAKERLMLCHQARNALHGKLSKGEGGRQVMSRLELDEVADAAERDMQFETAAVSQTLDRMPLEWTPFRYLVNNSSKDYAAALIEQARSRTGDKRQHDGIFIIRPSASKPSKLVLSVMHGDRVSHCLMEQCESGWGFENGGLHFVSLGDFVRYYAHNSLEEHNKEMRTPLSQPALSPSGH